MPGFMRERGPHAALSHFALFGVERYSNHDCFDTILAEFRKSQYSFWQVFVLRHDAKTLLDKTINTYGFRGIRIKTLFPQFIGANPVLKLLEFNCSNV
jgi:hypothetical protein